MAPILAFLSIRADSLHGDSVATSCAVAVEGGDGHAEVIHRFHGEDDVVHISRNYDLEVNRRLRLDLDSLSDPHSDGEHFLQVE